MGQVLAGITAHLLDQVDHVCVIHDGPPGFDWQNGRDIEVGWLPERRGVAGVKNELLRRGLDSGADWIILAEDDIVPQGPEAVTGYVEAAELSGIGHLNFAHHGPANACAPKGTDPTGMVTFWPNWVGAYSVTPRAAVEKVGLLDEDLYLALEHVEWALRMAEAGFCPLPTGIGEQMVADATGSEGWLAEIPGSIEASSILADGGQEAQRSRFAAAREIWKAKDPALYGLVFAR